MLPRTAKAGLLLRRQFHTSCIRLAKAPVSAFSKELAVIPGSRDAKLERPRPTQNKRDPGPSAEQIANQALSGFFRSAKPALSKPKATQLRHYGTFAIGNEILLSKKKSERNSSVGEKKNASSKEAEKHSKERDAREQRDPNESETKEQAPDKTKEKQEEGKDVSKLTCSLKCAQLRPIEASRSTTWCQSEWRTEPWSIIPPIHGFCSLICSHEPLVLVSCAKGDYLARV